MAWASLWASGKSQPEKSPAHLTPLPGPSWLDKAGSTARTPQFQIKSTFSSARECPFVLGGCTSAKHPHPKVPPA